MRKDIFAVPIFEFEVDLNFISVPVKEEQYRRMWESKVPTSFKAQVKIPKGTYPVSYTHLTLPTTVRV